MVLLSLSMDTLSLFLRVWLWMSVPMSLVILLWATWMNYRIIPRHQGGLKLAIEGWEGQAWPIGEGLSAGSGETTGEQRVSRGEEEEEVSVSHGGEVTLSHREEDGVSRGKEERVSRGAEERGGKGAGRDAIYQGILWMKEKYEQYREQADRRYELLREELRRSELRYQELVMSMGSPDQMIIDQLETQLRAERQKTEELTIKLRESTELLLKVYEEGQRAGEGQGVVLE